MSAVYYFFNSGSYGLISKIFRSWSSFSRQLTRVLRIFKRAGIEGGLGIVEFSLPVEVKDPISVGGGIRNLVLAGNTKQINKNLEPWKIFQSYFYSQTGWPKDKQTIKKMTAWKIESTVNALIVPHRPRMVNTIMYAVWLFSTTHAP